MTPVVAARRLRILELLNGGLDGATISELAVALGASRGCVRRDLDCMDACGVIVLAQDEQMRLHACLVVRQRDIPPYVPLRRPLPPPLPRLADVVTGVESHTPTATAIRHGIPPGMTEEEFVARVAEGFASSVARGDFQRADVLAGMALALGSRADA